MKVIGLTGGIGSGKSTVARFLAELGAVVVEADKLGHEAFKSGSETYGQVIAAFGKEVLSPDGEIDRKKLAAVVFDHPQALQKLNSLVHPQVGKMLADRLAQYRRQGVGVVVLEIPLLLEGGGRGEVDEVWVTVAPEETVVRRLAERSGLSREQVEARRRAQLSDGERLRKADVVIHTDCTLDELRSRVKKLWDERLLT